MPEIPIHKEFRISDLFRELLTGNSDYPHIIHTEIEVKDASTHVTNLLIDRDLAINVNTNIDDVRNPLSLQFDSQWLKLTDDKGRKFIMSGSYKNYARNWLQEPDHLKRLDWILDFMARHGSEWLETEDIWRRTKSEHPSLHVEHLESYRQHMFNKLCTEKYLSYSSHPEQYMVTLNGVLFIQAGGYSQERRDKQLRQVLKRCEIMILALAALVAIWYTVYQVTEQFLLGMLTAGLVFLFLTGAVSGIALWTSAELLIPVWKRAIQSLKRQRMK
jgi:hypothetical protein